MKKNEKNFIQNEKKEELNEKELDNVAGGYTVSGKGDVWVVNGITPDNYWFSSAATSREKAFDIAKKNKLKSTTSDGLKGNRLNCSEGDNFSIYNW